MEPSYMPEINIDIEQMDLICPSLKKTSLFNDLYKTLNNGVVISMF